MIRIAAVATAAVLAACSQEEEARPSPPQAMPAVQQEPVTLAPASADQARIAETAIEVYLQGRDFEDPELRYAYGLFDLNADGADEIIVRVTGPYACGATGGCPLYILTPEGEGWRRVGVLLATKAPIGVLETSTHGWRDLVIRAAAGAFESHLPRPVRFDGQVYPLDGVEPALGEEPPGMMLITDESEVHVVP